MPRLVESEATQRKSGNGCDAKRRAPAQPTQWKCPYPRYWKTTLIIISQRMITLIHLKELRSRWSSILRGQLEALQGSQLVRNFHLINLINKPIQHSPAQQEKALFYRAPLPLQLVPAPTLYSVVSTHKPRAQR